MREAVEMRVMKVMWLRWIDCAHLSVLSLFSGVPANTLGELHQIEHLHRM
jgi:hypothetical protein